MSDLVEQLRDSRKNPSVLKHSLISIRSVRPNTLVFVFEGQEDVGVFETWIRRTPSDPEYEPLSGKGKEQLLALHEKLQAENSDLLRKVFFFVDCDFDQYASDKPHVYVLNAYSIENILCSSDAIESLLTDEFRCAGAPVERDRILNQYRAILQDFATSTSDVNFLLFTARREEIDVVRKPEDVRDLVTIELTRITKAYGDVAEVISLDGVIDEAVSQALREEFNSLPTERAQRGKYLIALTRRWLQLLTNDRKSAAPVLFDRSIPNLPGEPWTFSLRRLATRSSLPAGLAEFVEAAAQAA